MAAPHRGRHRRPNRGRNRNDNYEHEQLQEDPALAWLTGTLVRRSLTLPITTRGIGMSVCSLVGKTSVYDYPLDDSSDEDEIIIQTPDIYALYRVCVGLLEYKLWNTYSPADMYRYKVIAGSIQAPRFWVPKDIQYLINAVGVFEHNGTTYIPAVAKDLDGVPRPENLLLSNLRRAVDLLSNPETPVTHRKYFYDHNPIPGAQWNKTEYLLLNADEIIKPNYNDNLTDNFNSDWNKINSYFFRLRNVSEKITKFAGGSIDLSSKGEKSLLISNKMETLRVPDRAVGTEPSTYCKNCYLNGDIGECYALARLSGGTVRLLGEYPEPDTFTDPVYKLRSEAMNGLTVFVDYSSDEPCRVVREMSPYPLTLSVSTRGIGMSVCHLVNASSAYRQIAIPDVYALYRLCLGLLEVKLSNYMFTPASITDKYPCTLNTNMTLIAGTIWVPKIIQNLLNAVRKFEHEGISYVPAVAKDVTDNLDPVPRPENLLLSNLRRAVEFLSNSETPVKHREYFYKHNSIPGAEWDKSEYQLLNANKIIPRDYDANLSDNFQTDCETIQPYINSLNRYSTRTPDFACGPIDFTSNGEESAKCLLISNKMETLRVPDLATNKELSNYFKRYRPEGDVQHYYALSRLSGNDILLGMTSLFGEHPEPGNCTDPIYDLRSETVARFMVRAPYSHAIQQMCEMII